MADDQKRDDKLLVLPLGAESKLITQTIANDTAREILELLADGSMSTSAVAKKLDIPLTTAQYNLEKLIEAGLVVVEKTKYSEKGREVKLYAPAKRMIVLVPRNTSNQAIMDALRKYLVLLPIAAVVSVFVELAMQLRNTSSGLKSTVASLGSSAPQAATENGTLLYNTIVNNGSGNNYWSGNGLMASPPPMPANDTMMKGAMDGILPGESIRSTASSAYGNLTESVNHTLAAAPAQTGTASLTDQASQAISSMDLLSHYGLWFFVGCLLIISILVAYELYKNKKN